MKPWTIYAGCCWVFTVIRLLKSGKSALVVGDWRGDRSGNDDQIHHRLLGCRIDRGRSVDPKPALLEKRLAVGRPRRWPLVIWLPNLVWEAQNHWISVYFLGSIHFRDVQSGLTSSFLTDQLLFNFNPVMLFLGAGRAVLLLLCNSRTALPDDGMDVPCAFHPAPATQGKGYYLAATYPMLAAGGAVWWEGRLTRITRPRWAGAWRWVTWSVLGIFAAVLIATELPVAPLWLGLVGWLSARVTTELKSEVGLAGACGTGGKSLQIRYGIQKRPTRPSWLPVPERSDRSTCTARPMACPGSSAASILTAVWLWKPSSNDPGTCSWFSIPAFWRISRTGTLIARLPTPFNIQNDEATSHSSILPVSNLRQPWPQFWKTSSISGNFLPPNGLAGGFL